MVENAKIEKLKCDILGDFQILCFKKLNSFDEFFVDFLSNNFVMKTREIKACLIILKNLFVLNFYPFLNAVGVNI